MIDDFPIEGEDEGYVPCDEEASPLDAEEEGAIYGIASGYVAQDQAASALPAPPREAIVGSGVGFVPAPCEECLPAGNAQGVFKAYRRFTPVTSTILDGLDQTQFPPRPAAIETTGGAIAAYGLAAAGSGREGTIQYTIPADMTLRVTIVISLFLSATTNNATHPRCYTNIPFTWELRRAGWGASFTPTYDDLQLDAVGSVLATGGFDPPETLCYPWTGTDPQLIWPITTFEDDFEPDVNNKIQFQLRISDLDADAAYAFNNHFYGTGWAPADEEDWDDFLYGHSVFSTNITVCALA